ncbi:MAG: hypothetical protein ABS36_00035 [Acidobacteria bacterium SCN 69-37]|nr:MAG: hypothetical protein ABS36_00035 [Acidobacteria bacterium SCN 69-37]
MAHVLIVGSPIAGLSNLITAVREAGHIATPVDVTSWAIALTTRRADVVLVNAQAALSEHVLGRLKRFGAPFIVVGAQPDAAEVVRVVKAGAHDYLTTPIDVAHLMRTLDAVRVAGEEGRGRTTAEHSKSMSRVSSYDCFVAVDPVTRRLGARLDAVAAVDSPVLITGETGTGKESAARRIHRASSRARALFLPINCGTLTESLIDSELFGHRRGAFTGAVEDSKGVIEAAAGGVLFLDEIGEIPPTLQVRLLRFLDNREVRRIGESSIRHVDVRVIAATNRDLREDMRSGRFRSDLFYRLSVLSINVPPLRDRPDDIPELARLSLRQVAARLRRPEAGLSAAALAALGNHQWPGNIRELQNVMEQAFVGVSGPMIDAQDLPSLDSRVREEAERPQRDAVVNGVRDALVHYDGNQTLAARALGISRTTLWRRRKRVAGSGYPPSLGPTRPQDL